MQEFFNIILVFSERIKEKLSLYKISNINPNVNVRIPKPITDKKKLYEKVRKKYDERISNLVIRYVKTLEANNLNFPMFYSNINTLKMKLFSEKEKQEIKKMNCRGAYNTKNSELKFLNFDFEDYIDHELLHASTSVFDKKNKTAYCGFHLKNDTVDIGVGINEGYTQVINVRYFNKNSSGYLFERVAVNIIEEFLGESEMLKLYSSYNLDGLISELSKYFYKDKVVKFIEDLDIACNSHKNNNVSPIELKASLIRIQNFLCAVLEKNLDRAKIPYRQIMVNIEKFKYNYVKLVEAYLKFDINNVSLNENNLEFKNR